MAFKLSCFADEISEELDIQLAVMKRHNIMYMEPRTVFGRNISELDGAQLLRFRQALDAAGVGVSAIGSPIGKIAADGDTAAHLEKFLRLTGIAHELNTENIRMFSFYAPACGSERWAELAMEQLDKLCEAAAREGVCLLHENEKDIYGDTAPRCLEIMKRYSAKGMKATFDPANFVQCGQPVMEAYSLLKPYIKYVHIKDALFADGRVVPAGCGDGEVGALLKALKAEGYDGFLSLEPHLGDFKGFAGLERGGKLKFDSDTDSVGRFDLAVSSLKQILEAI